MAELLTIHHDISTTVQRENHFFSSVHRDLFDHDTPQFIRILITTMESCTAGQIASLLTDTSGSSAIIEGAFVTYSNEAKIQIGVSDTILKLIIDKSNKLWYNGIGDER